MVEVAGIEPASERAGVSPPRPAPAKRCPLDGDPLVESCHPHTAQKKLFGRLTARPCAGGQRHLLPRCLPFKSKPRRALRSAGQEATVLRRAMMRRPDHPKLYRTATSGKGQAGIACPAQRYCVRTISMR
jgi:hypothetical protein